MNTSLTHAGNLFIIAAPSGAGKSSLVQALLLKENNLHLSISYTTRAARPGEIDGREYHFTSIADFLKRKNNNEFLEWAEVHGNYYGTSRIFIDQSIKAGRDVILEIDWQGAKQVKAQLPKAVGIFILPPSITVLEQRLNKRGLDSAQVIQQRLLAANGEIAHSFEFEYVIINQEFELALSELIAIIKATRCSFNQQLAKNSHLFADFGFSISPV